MQSLPDVSVILPVYNGEKYLKKAIESILNQTFSNIEIIVIDDGSTDASLSIIQDFQKKDKRLYCIQQPNQGIVSALNNGIAIAKSSFIARMDADDISISSRIEKQYNFLSETPNAVAVGSWVRLIDESDLPIYTYKMSTMPTEIKRELFNGNGGILIHPAAMFKKEALKAAGSYQEKYKTLEDLDLYFRLSKKGDLYNIPEVLLLYRQHLKSVNFTSEMTARRLLKEKLIQEHTKDFAQSFFNEKIYSVHEKSRLEIYHEWAQWALSEKFYKTTLKYTIKALFHKPFKKQSWAFFKYVLSSIISAGNK